MAWIRYQGLASVGALAMLFLINFSYCFEEEDSSSEEFVPTTEWQPVKPGQTIPPGLHIRMDLKDGGKWAKILDKEEKNGQTETAVIESNANTENEEKKETITVDKHEYKLDELKRALKNMKEGEMTNEELEHNKQIKEKFRSMDEIKSAFDELNLKQESDFEVMTRLLSTYNEDSSSVDSKVLALQEIEYYVHQVDNANDLIKIGGLQTVSEALNNTHAPIRKEAAHVIGSAVQSNPSAQVKAVQLGCLPTLLRLLSDTKQPMDVRRKALYALSSLIRNFPVAQLFFNNAGGFVVLMNLFKEEGAEKLQLKAISLINDLAVERRDLHGSKDEKQGEEKMRQYKLFSLSSVIDEMGFCEDLTSKIGAESHDWREVVIKAMRNLHGVCKQKPKYVQKVTKALTDFKSEYKGLLMAEEKEGDKDSFFHHMYAIVSELLSILKDDNPLKDRDEL